MEQSNSSGSSYYDDASLEPQQSELPINPPKERPETFKTKRNRKGRPPKKTLVEASTEVFLSTHDEAFMLGVLWYGTNFKDPDKDEKYSHGFVSDENSQDFSHISKGLTTIILQNNLLNEQTQQKLINFVHPSAALQRFFSKAFLVCPLPIVNELLLILSFLIDPINSNRRILTIRQCCDFSKQLVGGIQQKIESGVTHLHLKELERFKVHHKLTRPLNKFLEFFISTVLIIILEIQTKSNPYGGFFSRKLGPDKSLGPKTKRIKHKRERQYKTRLSKKREKDQEQ